MKPALRVLLVEDSEDDALLVLRQISTAGYLVDSARVDTELDYREALANGLWDVVICDYRLPSFGAQAALQILQETGLDLPFLVVSGSISAELAVDMMRAGARDYLLKDDLARLTPAIERELKAASRRKALREAEAARVAAERARQRSEQRYREIYQITTDCVSCVETDDQGVFRLVHGNGTFAQLFGIDVERDAGKPIEQLFPPGTLDVCLGNLRSCIESGRTTSADETLQLGARTLHLHSKMHPVKDEGGRIRRVIIVARDIAERKRGEEALRKAQVELEKRVEERTAELLSANARLRELDRLKSEFLATMSHELRTPLNSIIGFTSLVKEEIAGPLNEEQKKQLSMVYAASKHLLGLINDLLDVSRIEAGRLNLVNEPFDFSGVVAETLAQLKPLAQAKRLTLQAKLPQSPLPMQGDRRRCLQVLLNLVHNAVKFTEKGSVEIVVNADEQDVRVEVLDTGVGIKPNQLGQLFEAFKQLDGSARRSHEGTGLGLYLCRKLLMLLGGEISAESTHGQGTRIVFNVPRQLKPETNESSAKPAANHESNHPTR